MDRIAGVARQLAKDAIDCAIDEGGDSELINKARQFLADGDMHRDMEAFEVAVENYERALGEAQGASPVF